MIALIEHHDEVVLELARLYFEVEQRVKREQRGEAFNGGTHADDSTGQEHRPATARVS